MNKAIFFLAVLSCLCVNILFGQELMHEYFLIKNCQCSSYLITYPNKDTAKVVSDKSGNILSFFEGNLKMGIIDSFYHDNKGRIIKAQRFMIMDGIYKKQNYETYAYNLLGKIEKIESFNNLLGLVNTKKYRYNPNGRPIEFQETFYRNNQIVEKYFMRFKFVNDTMDLVEYGDKDVIVKGYHVYDKKGRLVKEKLENIKKGKRVDFVFTYDKEGRILSIHKSKVSGGDILLFNSDHYDILFDNNRKMSFIYDSKGRVSKIIKTDNSSVKKELAYSFKYN
jgi:hypothetical protein